MENEELNKKLLKFAGFVYETAPDYHQIYLGIIGGWYSPDARWYGIEPPNFPKSLDACFKWLVPKLDYYIQINTYYDEWAAFIDNQLGTLKVGSRGKTPALALCKAIEKLIDKEVKDESR